MTVQHVKVRRKGHRWIVSTAQRDTGINSPMERLAWNSVVSGSITVAEYQDICRKVRLSNRS